MTDERAGEASGRDPEASPAATRRAIEAVWRIESMRIVGALARYTGDFALAEDLAQEALAEALVAWSRDGVPRDPAGWLMTVGRRRAIDAFRRRSGLDDRYAVLAHQLGEGGAVTGSPGVTGSAPQTDLLWDPDRIDDDALALLFTACHPGLAPEARVALTLRVAGGLTSDEIARAFLTPTATVQARITRAKKRLADVAVEVPPAAERPERLSSVLSVVYLVFTEGAAATSGDSVVRFDLAGEAIRLARVLARLVPDEPEPQGLLALMELTAARFPARTAPDGSPVLLEDQDRRRWDRAAIRRGRAALVAARGLGRGLGAYGLQAAIAECHAVAPSVAETDWGRVVTLYDALAGLAPTPVVTLNRAVAVAMASGPEAGLAALEGLDDDPGLGRSPQLPAVRGEMHRRAGRPGTARAAFTEALRRDPSPAERQVLERKLAELG